MKDKLITALGALKQTGMTYQELGDLLGVSRQRVHKIMKGDDEILESKGKKKDHRVIRSVGKRRLTGINKKDRKNIKQLGRVYLPDDWVGYKVHVTLID